MTQAADLTPSCSVASICCCRDAGVTASVASALRSAASSCCCRAARRCAMLRQSRCSASGGRLFSSAIWLSVRPVRGQLGPPLSSRPCAAASVCAACCAVVSAAGARQLHSDRLRQPQGSGAARSPPVAACAGRGARQLWVGFGAIVRTRGDGCGSPVAAASRTRVPTATCARHASQPPPRWAPPCRPPALPPSPRARSAPAAAPTVCPAGGEGEG